MGTPSPFPGLVAFARAGFLRLLAYRLRYFTGIVTYTLNVAVYSFLWRAVYAGTDTLGGYGLEEMSTYVAVGWALRSFYFNNVDREIATLVMEGHIASYLTRPVSFLGAMTALAAGESLFRLFLFTGPITAVLVWLFPVAPPASPQAALLFALSAPGSFLLLAWMNFLMGSLAFRTRSVRTLLWAKHYLIQLLSGLLMPVTLFPAWLAGASRLLPFRHIATTPLELYLGRVTGGEAWLLLAAEAGWILLFYLAARLLWASLLRRLVIQGG